VNEIRLPGARALFSTRNGGVSAGPYESLNLGILTDDDPLKVSENRRRLAAAAGLEPARIAMGWQVHGTDFREWSAAPQAGFAAPGSALPRVDGHLTALRGLGLLVLVADCYPVALSDGVRAIMLHCGWRGLAGGILEHAIERFDDAPAAAAVGPGIGGCCYEVGPEVLRAFAGLDGVARGRMLDLRAVIAHKLDAAGVRDVVHVAQCTSCRPDLYFSHRRDRGLTGRQAGLVVLDA
jgi:YfiH family protein